MWQICGACGIIGESYTKICSWDISLACVNLNCLCHHFLVPSSERCWSLQARCCGAVTTGHVRSCYPWYDGDWESVGEPCLIYLESVALSYPYIGANSLAFSCMVIFSELADLGHSGKDSGRQLFSGTDTKPAIKFPPVASPQWEEQVP